MGRLQEWFFRHALSQNNPVWKIWCCSILSLINILFQERNIMWHFIKKYILQPLFLISFGGIAYFNFEILFRGYSLICMIICGGLCFYTIGLLNEGKNWHPSFLFQMILGSLIIITYEYLTGVIVNIYLNLHVWDYSKVPFN